MFLRSILIKIFILLFFLSGLAHSAPFLPEDNYEGDRLYWEKILSGEEDINNLSPEEKLSLLSYLGLHPSEEFIKKYANNDISSLKFFSREIILDDELLQISHGSPFIQEKIKESVPFVRYMLTSTKYEDLLHNLYMDISGRSPLDFWSNYDVFKNMISWGIKKGNLFTTQEIKISPEKTIKTKASGPELEKLSNALEEDIGNVVELLGFTTPEIDFLYQPRNPATAWYRYRNHKVFINLAAKNLSWPNLMAKTLWHELYHGYQYSAIEEYIQLNLIDTIELYVRSDTSEKEKIFLVGIYHANLFNYQEGEDHYQHYHNQPLEEHAFYYGNQIFQKILR